MDFKTSYPDYVAIEEHIRRAHLERSLALAQILADLVAGTIRGMKNFARSIDAARRGTALPEWARHLPSR